MNVVTKNRFIPKLANFDDFFARNIFNSAQQKSELSSVPSVNITETESHFIVKMVAPGLNKEDFQVKVWHDTLTIQMVVDGEKNYEDEVNYTHGKIDHQSFKRTLFLPDITDSGSIEASYVDGELKVEIPKKKEEKIQYAQMIAVS
ncbi:MAG: Hsp20/alpha crystallin family protein [Cyclobacteriaceae bacterium]